jgi:rod shape determining protein RodA
VQKRLHFVPEQHTDFIFTVVGEELGLVGGLVLLALYLYLVLQSLRTAARAPDRFGGLLAAGVGCLLGLHVVINIGMVIGLMPITGLPLPFLSYGGSALLTTMTALGLLTSVWIRRRIRPLGTGIKPDPLYATEGEGRTVLHFE